MKKNILLVASLIVLGLITWWMVHKQQNKGHKSFDFSYREFALDDLDQLYRIVIAKRNEEPLTFTRKSNYWMLNNTWIARENAIDNILDVFKNIQIDYVPPNSAIENIMTSFLQNGIKVELYDKRDKPLKKFYVGASPADGMGTYFVMEGSEKPLVMSLPSMKGTVHPRFNYSLEEWRDMTVLNMKPGEIVSLEVSYPFNKKFSFKYDGQTIRPLHQMQKTISGEPDSALIANYLHGFESKVAEYIENKNPKREEILLQIPFCEMRITDTQGNVRELTYYYHTRPDADILKNQTTMMEAYNPYHAERFFIETSWGDFYLAQQIVFKDIFWKYDSFFKHQD